MTINDLKKELDHVSEFRIMLSKVTDSLTNIESKLGALRFEKSNAEILPYVEEKISEIQPKAKEFFDLLSRKQKELYSKVYTEMNKELT